MEYTGASSAVRAGFRVGVRVRVRKVKQLGHEPSCRGHPAGWLLGPTTAMTPGVGVSVELLEFLQRISLLMVIRAWMGWRISTYYTVCSSKADTAVVLV